ncbi:membrane bound O-acyl transferase family-domain-containing protein [Leptodontidium sp. MPI-SDFR-AT-0119]|nr:membrane bound O-acyl transferase family-domain-containing protein [Leptodontidium sp. MPI-SDFR-AT-0119]
MDTAQLSPLAALSHPITFLVVEVAVILGILSATPLCSFRARLMALVPLVACLYGIITTAPHTLRMSWGGLVCGTAAFCTLHYLDVALLRWAFGLEAGKPRGSSTPPNIISQFPIDRFRHAFSTLSSFRKVNTPAEVKNVPLWKNGHPPSYSEFLRSTATSIVLHALVLDLSSLAPPPEPGPTPFAPEKLPLFRNMLNNTITTNDILARFVGTFAHWLLTYCFLRCCYDSCAFVLVASNLTSRSSWRPMFGPVADMFTLRGFWGSTWHQLVRDPCGQPASFMAHSVLGLQRTNGNLAARYSKLFFSFMLSGLVHAAADLAAGIPFKESGSLKFFLTQVVGIMVEDTVRILWGDGRVTDIPRLNPSWRIVVGYIWVGLWLFWTTPTWSYPPARHYTGDSFLPFSFFKSQSAVLHL